MISKITKRDLFRKFLNKNCDQNYLKQSTFYGCNRIINELKIMTNENLLDNILELISGDRCNKRCICDFYYNLLIFYRLIRHKFKKTNNIINKSHYNIFLNNFDKIKIRKINGNYQVYTKKIQKYISEWNEMKANNGVK